MVPRILLATTTVPGGAELKLFRRGDAFSITLHNNELMNSRMSGSEEALAALACARIGADARVLIGGLGMGFTLRETLARLGPGASVTVAEIVGDVIAWAQGPIAVIMGGCLDDPRVRVVEADVAEPIAAGSVAGGGWDAILLDVDNGPEGLARAGNGRLYGEAGLRGAARALRPGGVLAVWSATPAPAFVKRLSAAGFAVEEHVVRARGDRGARHVVWIATPA